MRRTTGLLNRIWQGPNLIAYLLWPLSLIFRFCVRVRKFVYASGLKKVHYFDVPVVVVGNISVGGTGKSPIVSAVVRELANRGWKPGIVSRGYGGESGHWPQSVSASTSWRLVGDEPVMLAEQTGCPLVVDPDRVTAVEEILRTTDCDIVISDDGLQHLALGRYIEIAVVDGNRGFGNGFCLPAGPLREPESRLGLVDFVIYNGGQGVQGIKCRLVGDRAVNLADTSRTKILAEFAGERLHAVAGIGDPSRFFSRLKQEDIEVVEHGFPDHYRFTPTDVSCGGETVLMTEKDAIKCREFATELMWYLPVEAKLEDDFYEQLENGLKQYDRQKTT